MWNLLKRPRQERSRNVDQHFVPGRGVDLRDAIRAGDETAVHHLIRYEWAARCLADWPVKNLLDLATGSGYGAYDLAVRFPSMRVTGVDYDPGAIEHARTRYALPKLGYRTADATRWAETIGPEAFDAIVSFDMIEHVVHREIMMENVVRHLAPGGTLLLPTPCGHLETVLRPVWSTIASSTRSRVSTTFSAGTSLLSSSPTIVSFRTATSSTSLQKVQSHIF